MSPLRQRVCDQLMTGSQSAGKRSRSVENEQPCKSARLEGIRQDSQIVQNGRDNMSEEDQDLIAYWSQYYRWPHKYFEESDSMVNILARKRSASSRSRKNSDTGSLTPSLTTSSTQKPRDEMSVEYKDARYESLLATKGSFMRHSSQGVTSSSKSMCRTLLERDQQHPKDTLFRDDLFESTCEKIRNRNETRVVRDISLLLVPSAEVLTTYGATNLECLIESVNEGWTNSIPLTKTRPQPDYAVGFRREAFTQVQLDRMQPIVGDFLDQSYFMATYYMYFPFLTCESKCGAAALEIADRQNAHSMTIAVRAVVELFRAVKREKDIHREILAFSISHDNTTVRLYGHYAEVDGPEPKYYRHSIHKFDFTTLEGKEKWTAYKFTKNIYDVWMPMQFQRICSAIDEIPPDVSFAMSESDLRFSEQSESGLSPDVSAYRIAQSSVGSRSVQAQDAQSSVVENLSSTPSTSVDEGAFKKPRRDHN